MKTLRLKFWGLVLVQVLFLLFIVARYHYALSSGVPVLLKVVPVDPRDLLRGDYVTLSYDISTVDLSQVSNMAGKYNTGDTVYVRLSKGDKFWTAAAVDDKFHATSSSEVWMKGHVYRNWRWEFANGKVICVNYGIEQFFVPEGTGRAIERERNNKNLSAEIKVSYLGQGIIGRIYNNDQPIDLKPVK